MEGWMECRGGGCREAGAGGSLGGSQGRPGVEVEGLEAEREAGLDESSDGKNKPSLTRSLTDSRSMWLRKDGSVRGHWKGGRSRCMLHPLYDASK